MRVRVCEIIAVLIVRSEVVKILNRSVEGDGAGHRRDHNIANGEEPVMTNERASEATRDDLKHLRQGLLRLHKILLDLERRDYERARGRISNSYEFLQLVLKDPWFDWLHRLIRT